MPTPADGLEDRIQRGEARVGVIGLGYVGLPLVRCLVAGGYPVLGFDTDPEKVAKLASGHSYIRSVPSEEIAEWTNSGRFTATFAMGRLAEADVILICVPTPLGPHREPDLSYVISTAQDIAHNLRPGQLILLESTTYPGTLRQVVLPILAQCGLIVGQDYFLAYSPEREDPGNPMRSAANIPKVVGGLDATATRLATCLYARITPSVHPVSSPEVAEASKILENTYRAVNIALVNELKMLFSRMGIDIWEVIAAASTKPFGFQPFYPGPGMGGHCIPIDPFYLAWIAKQFDFPTRFIELAGEINAFMPGYVVDQVLLALNSVGKPVRGSRIGVLGLAYKRDVDDPRESPSLELIDRLQKLGAEVSYNDPFIPRIPRMRRYTLDLESQPLGPDWLSAQDALLIATDHSQYDWDLIAEHSALIIDTRNATGRLTRCKAVLWRA